MGIKFFGQYLLEKGIITRDQLLEAMEFQRSHNLRLGEHARRLGYLNEEQIQQIHAAQRHQDLPFGELAVRLGFLTPKQLEEVIAAQRAHHLYIGEVLVQKGFLSREALERELEAFHADQAPYRTGRVEVPPGIPHPEAVEAAVDLTGKLLQRVAGIQTVVGPCRVAPRQVPVPEDGIRVNLNGSLDGTYLLVLSRAMSLQVAGAMLQRSVGPEESEYVLDAVKEFANIVVGNLAAKLALRGQNVTPAPPVYLSGVHPAHGVDGLIYPFHAAEDTVEMGFFWVPATASGSPAGGASESRGHKERHGIQ